MSSLGVDDAVDVTVHGASDSIVDGEAVRRGGEKSSAEAIH